MPATFQGLSWGWPLFPSSLPPFSSVEGLLCVDAALRTRNTAVNKTDKNPLPHGDLILIPTGASYRYVQRGLGVMEENQSKEGDWECLGGGGVYIFEQSGLERLLLGWSHLPRDLEEARKSDRCVVSGERASLEERTVSVHAPGRQESAWCASGIAGRWCEGAVVGDGRVTSEAESCGLSCSVGQSCETVRTTWGTKEWDTKEPRGLNTGVAHRQGSLVYRWCL